jgi:hypothetical protein
VRAIRWAWALAFVWLGVSAVWLTAVFIPIREHMRDSAYGMAPFEASSRPAMVVLALFALGHLVPVLFPPRRLAPRYVVTLGSARDYRTPAEQRVVLQNGDALARASDARGAVVCAMAVASALGIAWTGYSVLRHSFHGPHQDPLEFLAYFYAALFTLATHAPRLLPRVASRTSHDRP